MHRLEDLDIPILEGEEEWSQRVIDEHTANTAVEKEATE